jgi:hypothetical protein
MGRLRAGCGPVQGKYQGQQLQTNLFVSQSNKIIEIDNKIVICIMGL